MHAKFPSDPSAVSAWLADRRWYGDKSRTITHVATKSLSRIALGSQEIELATLDLRFADGGSATYFIPLVVGTSDASPQEALTLQVLQNWLGSGFAEGRQLDLGDGAALVWRSSSAESEAWWDQEPRQLEGEQSNTSIRFGFDAVIKVFRKWQPGINPDTEIVEFLTEQTDFRQVPAYLGGIRLEQGDQVIEVAAVQNFVTNQGDSWKWLPPALASLAPDEVDSLLAEVRLLGQRTGEMHVALASGRAEAFAPEPIEAEDVADLGLRVTRELSTTVRMLEVGGYLSADSAAELERVLSDRLRATSALTGTKRTRVHGDYHLGQVLRSDSDFIIIDFEGEPSRSMDERRARHSPLKDVAGMLRSLDYAVATAIEGSAEDQREFLRDVGLQMDEAFLAGYRGAIASGPGDLLPGDDAGFVAALDLYMIDKALYEARYELDNRPTWIGIPLGALLRIANQPG